MRTCTCAIFSHRARTRIALTFIKLSIGLRLISAATGFKFGVYPKTRLSRLICQLSETHPSLTVTRVLGCTVVPHNPHFSCASHFSPLKCFKNTSKLSSIVAKLPWRDFYSQLTGKANASKGSP